MYHIYFCMARFFVCTEAGKPALADYCQGDLAFNMQTSQCDVVEHAGCNLVSIALPLSNCTNKTNTKYVVPPNRRRAHSKRIQS